MHSKFNAVPSADVFSTPVPQARKRQHPAPDGFPPAAPSAPLTRRYEIAYLDADGLIEHVTRIAPATPDFENAFSALARGTVVATAEGPVAVEDLAPGMQALTAEGETETITWIGSMTLFPRHAMADAMPDIVRGSMIRVTADAFGVGRPMPDLILGPAARLLIHGAEGLFGTVDDVAYGPAANFVDGVSIIEVSPVTPVTVYHVTLARHGSLRAAGLEIESYHPGARLQERLGPELSERFLALFPHLSSFADFGPVAHPRMAGHEVDAALHG